jgi:hypothetical protein
MSHGVRLAVLVAICKEERSHHSDGGVVRGRRVELEEVEDGQRREEQPRPPQSAVKIDKQAGHDDS